MIAEPNLERQIVIRQFEMLDSSENVPRIEEKLFDRRMFHITRVYGEKHRNKLGEISRD